MKIRSFLALLLNPVMRRFLVFLIDEPERSFFIEFLAGLLFGFCSPDFSLWVAYVKSEQFGHKSGPERGGYFRGQFEASEGLPGTRNKKSLCWGILLITDTGGPPCFSWKPTLCVFFFPGARSTGSVSSHAHSARARLN